MSGSKSQFFQNFIFRSRHLDKVTRPYGTVLINVDRRPGNRFHDIKQRPMTMTRGERGGND